MLILATVTVFTVIAVIFTLGVTAANIVFDDVGVKVQLKEPTKSLAKKKLTVFEYHDTAIATHEHWMSEIDKCTSADKLDETLACYDMHLKLYKITR